jgi:peptide-methionine (S)-S-oxide reductase
MFSMFTKKLDLPTETDALVGRDDPILSPRPHAVTGRTIVPPFPEGLQKLRLGMGCFWGAERLFWQTKGVWTTSVGYAGGYTKNASYREVCSGETGHTEVVEVVFDPTVIDLDAILKIFWESHDPTQGMRQGNDIGTQYRSAIYVDDDATLEAVLASRDRYQAALTARGLPQITTEIAKSDTYFLAEDDHQQYLYKVPHGYCGLRGTGVDCPSA